MDAILQFVQQHPEAQAAVAGALVSVAMGVYKRLRPRAGVLHVRGGVSLWK